MLSVNMKKWTTGKLGTTGFAILLVLVLASDAINFVVLRDIKAGLFTIYDGRADGVPAAVGLEVTTRATPTFLTSTTIDRNHAGSSDGRRRGEVAARSTPELACGRTNTVRLAPLDEPFKDL